MINPNIELAIQRYIESFLDTNDNFTITDILENFDTSIKATRAELINTINNALIAGNLEIIDKKVPWTSSTVVLKKSFLFKEDLDLISIVISKPRLRELSLKNREKRNDQIDTITCFREIITSSKSVLRICSPFIQENVLDDGSFPELHELLTDALKRDVEIRLLSRELSHGRGNEVQWIIDAARAIGKRHNLRIVDYHLLSENRSILSSTHAKIIVADYTQAYVGSAELRKNSLVANFEVGCLVKGPQVYGICEIFDLMFFSGRIWDE
ncbi:phospholipase D-like domain-containing protein [uncultured Methanolobus sp.]|uniref:phospholipase D-like domain-containing protein n=1 Tax=uncultured Methanolobus sp. TaxID=218300 RepID=UPI0029C7CE62|nr:phospholipase D-like domain-containing protein [uncultured Methanolobus sp.]